MIKPKVGLDDSQYAPQGDKYYCGSCDKLLCRGLSNPAKFCSHCGGEVDWSGVEHEQNCRRYYNYILERMRKGKNNSECSGKTCFLPLPTFEEWLQDKHDKEERWAPYKVLKE